MPEALDPYAVLGCRPTDDAARIRGAFLDLAWRAHPDRGGDVRRMQAVNAAYEILGNRRRRAAYDQLQVRHAGSTARQAPPPSATTGPSSSARPWPRTEHGASPPTPPTEHPGPGLRRGSDGLAGWLLGTRLGQWGSALIVSCGTHLFAAALSPALGAAWAMQVMAALLALEALRGAAPADTPYWPLLDVQRGAGWCASRLRAAGEAPPPHASRARPGRCGIAGW
ncbi:MAG: J domain-containing protein [Candidatus Limnocylindrales bacterium]